MASHVTWVEIQRIQLYCEWIRNLLNIPHWDIGVSVDPCDDGSQAEISSDGERYMADLHLNRNWHNYPHDEKRSILLHEMLHLLHKVEDHFMDSAMDSLPISDQQMDALMNVQRTAHEYMVDGLTTALLRVGFAPAWPTKKEAKARNHQNRQPYCE